MFLAFTHSWVIPLLRINAIELAETSLIKFVVQVEQLYGLKCCTFNVHCLTHLAKCVKNCGPLWATSAFEFEAHNHMLLKMFNGTQYANQQIANTFLLKKAILLLTMQYTGESTSVSGKVELQQKVYHCK